jgi:hypothetical protein
MNIAATRRPTLLVVCLLSFACQRQVAEKETPPFRIVATDADFEAPGATSHCFRESWN